MMRRSFALVLIVFFGLTITQQAFSQVEVYRQKLGGFPEASTYISTGAFKGNIAILDGNDVYLLPRNAVSSAALHKQFSLYKLPFYYHPNGLAYIPAEQLMVFTEGSSPQTLFFSDMAGRPKGTVTIQYIGDFSPVSIEGIAYIPPDASMYPDHFLMAAAGQEFFPDGDWVYTPRIEVIQRDGKVVKEIFPAPDQFDVIGGVAYVAPNCILYGFEGRVRETDFDGQTGRVGDYINDFVWFEGVTYLPDGRVFGLGIDQSGFGFFDSTLSLIGDTYRHYDFGVKLRAFNSIAWDSDSNQYLVASNYALDGNVDPQIVSFSKALSDFALFEKTERSSVRMAYMPDEHRLAVVSSVSKQPSITRMTIYERGLGKVEEFYTPAIGNFTYIPGARQFAARGSSNPDNTWGSIRLYQRNGSVDRDIDISSFHLAITGISYFEDNGGRFLLCTAQHLCHILDMQGTLISQFAYRDKLNVMLINRTTPITSGPNKGGFAVIDNGGELVVFKLNGDIK